MNSPLKGGISDEQCLKLFDGGCRWIVESHPSTKHPPDPLRRSAEQASPVTGKRLESLDYSLDCRDNEAWL